MRHSHTEQETTAANVNLTPLIDMVFILLIFFAVSTTLVLNQRGIELTLPAAVSTQAHKNEDLRLSIDPKQRVFFNGRQVSESHIRTKVADLVEKKKDLKVILEADRLTPYSLLIRVMDEIRLGGAFNIILETRQK